MNQNNQNSLTMIEVLRQLDARNPQNVALAADLGMRTSADIFEATQKEHEEARRNTEFATEWNRRQGSVSSHEVGTESVTTTNPQVMHGERRSHKRLYFVKIINLRRRRRDRVCATPKYICQAGPIVPPCARSICDIISRDNA